jgi:hypothetical protein
VVGAFRNVRLYRKGRAPATGDGINDIGRSLFVGKVVDTSPYPRAAACIAHAAPTKAAELKAAALGIEKLYLYTPESLAYYEILGWALVEHRNVSEKSVAVMSKDLMPDSKRPTHAFSTEKPAR